MSRLIESIKLVDGRFCNLFYHEQRMIRSLHALFGRAEAPGLEQYLLEQEFPKEGLFKCRIVYDAITRVTTISPYVPKKIEKVKLVSDDQIDYAFKYEDRSAIDRLFALRGDCDDVLIVRKGRVTDCSFSNILFRKGRAWYTPGTPLLEGTMRRNLLDKKIIQAREILKTDIRSFDTFRIINAMLEFDGPEIEVSDIVF